MDSKVFFQSLKIFRTISRFFILLRVLIFQRWHSDTVSFNLEAGERTSVPAYQRPLANGTLRRPLVKHFVDSLLAKPDQGKDFEVVRMNHVSRPFLRCGRNTRFCDWCFINRARINVCHSTRLSSGRSHTPLETIPHVLRHCGIPDGATQRRHNDVQDRLVKAKSRCPGFIAVK